MMLGVVGIIAAIMFIKPKNGNTYGASNQNGHIHDKMCELLEYRSNLAECQKQKEKCERQIKIWKVSSEDDPVSKGKIASIKSSLSNIDKNIKKYNNAIIETSKYIMENKGICFVEDESMKNIIIEYSAYEVEEIDEEEINIL